MENGNAVEPCVSNVERETSPHVLKQRNGIRPGFLNNHKTVVAEDADTDQEREEVHPEHVPTFSQATPPRMVTADYTSITLQWSAVTQTGFSPSPPEGTDLPICSMAYSLQMQQVCVFVLYSYSQLLCCFGVIHKQKVSTGCNQAFCRRGQRACWNVQTKCMG